MAESKIKGKVGRPRRGDVVQMGLRLSRKAYDRLEAYARETFRSKSEVVEKLLAEKLP